MLLKLIRFFQGYVTISITGKFAERFINICIVRKIAVWNIKRISPSCLTLCMSCSDFLCVIPIAKKSRTKIKILSKHGLRYSLKQKSSRKWFFTGLLVFVSFMFITSNFIWTIDINGLTYTSEEELLKTLKANGLYPGVLKQNIDQLQLKNSVLLEHSELSWIWIDIKGTRAIVNAAQRTNPPEISDNTPCDIIAAKDGIIKSYTAKSGNAKIEEGDSVLSGQLLISGIMTSELTDPRYVKADGEVWARTWYTEEDIFDTTIYLLCETGNKKTYRTLNIFGADINLFFNKNPKFATYNRTDLKSPIKIFGKTTGIQIKTSILNQTEPIAKHLNENELLNYAENELLQKIHPNLSENSELLQKSLDFQKISDTSYKITLTAEFCEQIGVSVPIEINQY